MTATLPDRLFDSAIDILILGDVMLDGYSSGEVDRISPEAPVPILRHLSHKYVPGGAANVAANIAAFGGRPKVVGVIGADDEGALLRRALSDTGIATRLIEAPGRPTTSKMRIMAGKQQMMRIDKEDAQPIDRQVESVLIDEIVRALPTAKALILSDYRKGTLTDAVLIVAIDQAREQGIPVLVDPKRADLAAYAGADFITPNRAEMKLATGITCDDRASCRYGAKLAMQASGSSILLTRSERGMVLFEKEGSEIWLPTEAREVFDVSGAGDTVIAAFAYALASGQTTDRALRIANCAASVVIGRAGTATVTEDEIMRAMDEGQRLPVSSSAVDWPAAIRQREAWRSEKLVVGFTNGCFDLFHPGHVKLLREAAANCDRLIVGLNSDASVARLKGPTRPIQKEGARAEVMAAIRHVDLVILFDDDTPLALIEALVPDILVKGSDYQEHEIVGAGVVKDAGGRVVRIELQEGQSTTQLVARSAIPVRDLA